ncbi:MAG: CidA/LrgA family protein [Phyllobacteriaceae bacterium]|nr:CidA/LrgA family protein [Phyllobacteriaceae bacterium]
MAGRDAGMLNYLTLIFVCQLAGELAVTATGVPLPGPVAGMVLLFLFLVIRNRFVAGTGGDEAQAADGVPADLARVADGLLSHLSLLFVPAGVGIMAHFSLLKEDWLPLSVAIAGSSALTIAVTAWLMTVIPRGIAENRQEKGGPQ